MSTKKTGMMEIAFRNGIIKADAKAMMVDLKDIERMGMAMAGVDDVKYFYKSLNYFMENKDTKEFILELNKQKLQGITEKDIINRVGRGRNSKAFGCNYLAVKYAEYLGLNHVDLLYKLSECDSMCDSIISEGEISKIEYFNFNSVLNAKKRNNKSCGVYVISCPSSSDGAVKIGIASDPIKRMKTLQVGCWYPLELKMFHECDNAKELEEYLHELFKKNRLSGEWFRNITENEVLRAIDSFG